MGVGAAASTLARPRPSVAAVRSEQPRDPHRGRRRTWSEPRARPRAAPRCARVRGSERSAPGRPGRARPPLGPPPEVLRFRGAPALRGLFPLPSPLALFFRDSWRGRGGEGEAEEDRSGGRGGGGSREKVACPNPGGGGGGGRGKTMPRLRRGERRERARRARRAGRPGSGRLRGGARRSEAPASAPPSPDAAGDRAGLRQPPPSPPPPPGGPSKSLDLGEDAALSEITTGAGRRPREPSQSAD